MKIKPNGFRFLLLVGLVFCTVAFTSDAGRSQYILPIKARSVSSADIDLDGDLDIIVGHLTAWQQNNKTISVLTNLENGNFIISDTSKNYCGYQENIFAIKINNDDYPDVVTYYSDFSSGVKKYIRVWYNVNGLFNNYIDFDLNNPEIFSDINYGDVNADNLLDIIVLSNNGRFFGVLVNLGNGILSQPTYYSIPDYPPLGVACSDLNNDGRDDVVICGQYLEVYISTITGFQKTFVDNQSFKDKVAIADFDLDGWKDIIADNGSVANSVWTNIYQNIGDGNFSKLDDHFFLPGASAFLVNDFNNDTLPDIAYLDQTLILDTNSGIHIVYNEGNFQISDPQYIKIENLGEAQRNFHSVDMDGNGYNDFAIVRGMGIPMKNLELLFNDGESNFGPEPFVDIAEHPQIKQQLSCYPNPFCEHITFDYEIYKSALVELVIYNLQGKLVKQVINQKQKGGHYLISWNSFSRDNAQNKNNVLVACLKVNCKMQKSIKLIQL